MDISPEENDIMYIYEWVDSISLSRPKKNISRDFSDGFLIAEIIKSYIPRIVELHNYPTANSTSHKKINWNTLNGIIKLNSAKVFRKMGFQLSSSEIDDIITYKHMAVENLLKKIYQNIQVYDHDVKLEGDSPQKDQTEDRNKDNFYKKQLAERDNIIEELRLVLELTETKLKMSEDRKKDLEVRTKDYSDKIKKLGKI